MNVLNYRPDSLADLAASRASLVEELDFATGRFEPVYGKSASGLAVTDLVPFVLTKDFVVGRFLPNPRVASDSHFLAQSLSLLYQRNWTSLLLDTTLRPLDFQALDDAYFLEIAQRTLESMRARYSIIRLYSDNDEGPRLRCVAVSDNAGALPTDLRLYDIPRGDRHWPIYERIEQSFFNDRHYLHVLNRVEHQQAFSAMTMPGTRSITHQSVI